MQVTIPDSFALIFTEVMVGSLNGMAFFHRAWIQPRAESWNATTPREPRALPLWRILLDVIDCSEIFQLVGLILYCKCKILPSYSYHSVSEVQCDVICLIQTPFMIREMVVCCQRLAKYAFD